MEKKEILCEIIGIILGDGYLRYDSDNYKYGFNISLNGIDDYDYYQYVKKLLSEFFQKKLSEIWYRDLKNAQGDKKLEKEYYCQYWGQFENLFFNFKYKMLTKL